MDDLLLNGLDGGNPLGMLALLGTLCVASRVEPRVLVRWAPTGRGWRPTISGHGLDSAGLSSAIAASMERCGPAPFDVDARLPFPQPAFRAALERAAHSATASERRTVDLLAGLGSDAFKEDDGTFHDTSFRLVRSGDSSRQGLPHYVAHARAGLRSEEVERTLFDTWRYADDCFALRWDPAEDQPHALRASDPSNKANRKTGERGVKAANALAAEALALFPVQPQEAVAATTGFADIGRRQVFTWPIWTTACGVDLVRSLLTLGELTKPHPDPLLLAARGIAQVFRSERFASSKYYKNFAPAQPV